MKNQKTVVWREMTTMNLAGVLRWHLGVLSIISMKINDPAAYARLEAELSGLLVD